MVGNLMSITLQQRQLAGSVVADLKGSCSKMFAKRMAKNIKV